MWLRQLYHRFQDVVHELGKFGAVGVVAYLIDTVIFLTLRLRGMESLTAGTIATVIAASVAFVGNRFWTWRHRARSGLAREYAMYLWLNAVGLAIVLVVLGTSHYGLGAVWPGIFHSPLADLVAKNVVGLALGSAFRFWSYRRFVFRAVVPAELAPAATTTSDT